jgi:ribosomal protein L22
MSPEKDDKDLVENPESTSDSEVKASKTSESDIDSGASDDASEAAAAGDGEAAAEEAEPAAEPVGVDSEGEETPEEAEGPEAEAEGDELEPDAEDLEAEAVAESEEPEAETEPEPEPKPKPARRRRGAAKEEEPAAPPAPAPRRQRGRREPGAPRPVVRAQAKYVRSSARKARLVCDHIRGKSVEEARAILAVTPRAVARDWSKLLESAVANAEHNHELVGEDLYVKAVHADEGPTIKRFRPRAMGRATKIRKRTAHLTILLTPKD